MTLAEQPTTATRRVDDRSRWRRMIPTLAVGGGVALATVALHARDPHQDGSWGKCPSLVLFGVYCPFCGGLRGVNDLTHLDLGAAVSSNLLLVVALPILLIGWAVVLRDRWRGSDRPWWSYLPTGRWASALIALAVVFSVVRNLPFGAGLSP